MAENKSFKFTKANLEALPPAPKGTAWYFDTLQRNLAVGVSPAGYKAFYVYRKVKGRKVRFKLGRFPDVSVDDARTDCGDYINKIERGEDVESARREARQELTLGEMFDEYLRRHAKPHKKSWCFEEMNFKNHLAPVFGNRKLSAITQAMVERHHAKLAEERGKVIANRVLALLTLIYNKAREWGRFSKAKDSPTRYVKKFKEKARERFLQGAEMPAFFQALYGEPNADLRDYILVSLFTGARKGNVLSMTWHEVNFDHQEWRIPETKNGEPLTIPLVDEVVEILKSRKKKASSIFVFPSDSATGHMVDPKKGWQRILKRAGMMDTEGNWIAERVTLHDLRRTLGSWQTIAGASPFIVGRSLGHKDMKSTQVYARMNLDPVRESVKQATALIVKMGVESE